MFQRRRDDPAGTPHPPPNGGAVPLPEIAAAWLRGLLRDDFGEPFAAVPQSESVVPAGSTNGAEEAIVRQSRREWLRRWRRLQLPEQLAAFRDALEEAASPDAVHATFSEHATSLVGAYVCLVFLPRGPERLEPLRLPGGQPTPEKLWVRAAIPEVAEVIVRPDITPESPLAGVAPLFDESSAAALLVTPYLDGCAVLVERRQAREFEVLDRQLLDLLVAEAGTALKRVAVAGAIGMSAPPEASPQERIETVLHHARIGAALGLEVTFARIRVEGVAHGVEPGSMEGLMRHCAAVIRREARGAGPVLRTADREYMLVINGGQRSAEALLERIRGAFGSGARLAVSIEVGGSVGVDPPDVS